MSDLPDPLGKRHAAGRGEAAAADEADKGDQAAEAQEAKRGWFLRRPAWVCRLLAVPFLAACIGVLTLVILYHWPEANLVVYYFTVRPAFVWLGGLVPFLLIGVAAVRLRWFLCGCLLWLVGLAAMEEVIQPLKLFPVSARRDFVSAQKGYWSFIRTRDGQKAERLDVPLRIVTWNVKAGAQGAEQVVADLARLMPDIVLMQEFYIRDAVSGSEYFKDYDLTGLKRETEAILSRYKVEKLPNVPPAPEARNLRWRCTVWKVHVGNDMHVICINVHLSPPAVKSHLIRGVSREVVAEAIAIKRAEFKRLEATLKHYAKEGPIILAGDFNVPPHYPGLPKATADLKDCFADNGYGWGRTAPAKLPLVRIDMIFVPREGTVYYAGAVPTHHSDHYMALAEVTLPLTRKPVPSRTVKLDER